MMHDFGQLAMRGGRQAVMIDMLQTKGLVNSLDFPTQLLSHFCNVGRGMIEC